MLNEFNIKELSFFLKNEKLILYPTDTIYGILGNVFSKRVIKNVLKIKHRPLGKPFLILIPKSFLSYFYFPKEMEFLLKYKITFISECFHQNLKNIYKEIFNVKKIAFRVPKKYFLLKLLNYLQYPLIAPSANISGFEPIYNLKQAKKYFFKNIKIFVKGTVSNKPSTILEILDEKSLKLIRKGADFEKVLSDCHKRGIQIQGANFT